MFRQARSAKVTAILQQIYQCEHERGGAMRDLPLAGCQTATDQQLLQMVIDRDTKAFELLYDRHATVLYNLLLNIVRNPETAEELVQDTFWQVWRKAEQYQGSGPVAAWLFRIARNRAFDELRRQRSRPQKYVSQADLPEEWSAGRTLSGATTSSTAMDPQEYWTNSVRELTVALQRIPAEQRHCVELAFFEGLSHSEIAEQTNVPLGTVKTRLRCALEKIGRMLQGMGVQRSYA